MEALMKNYRYATLALLLLILTSACSTARHVPDGSYLLSSVKIQIDSLTPYEREQLGDLELYLTQQPNTRILGLFKWTLGVYSLSNPKSNSFLNRQLRKWGDPPVLYSEQEAEFGRANLTAAMYNAGYLKAQTTLEVDTSAYKKAKLHYHIEPGPLFYVGHGEEVLTDSLAKALLYPKDSLHQMRLFRGESYTSHLSPGSVLSPQNMQRERERISQILMNRGYYSFSSDSVRYEVDTLEIKNAWVRKTISVPQQVYRIGQVSFKHEGSERERPFRQDSLGGIAFSIDPNHYIRPGELAHRIWVRPGTLYSQQNTSRTYAALSDLAPLRNISLRYYIDSLRGDSTLLNCDIITAPEPSKSLSGDIVGTNSSGNLGVSASLTFQHNNLFSGGEQFQLQLRGGYEAFSSRVDDHYSYGIESSLSFPRLLVPFLNSRGPSNYQSATNLKVSYDYHGRPEFSRDIFSLEWGYSWHSHYTPAYRHHLKVLDLDFLHFVYVNESFRQSMPLITQILNYRDQFVLGASYLLRYNSLNDYRLSSSPWVHNLRLYLQSSGALLYGLSEALGRERDGYGSYKFFGTNFAQFIKGEFDYSGLRKLGEGNAVAYHLGLAIAVPYGNSQFVPVDLRYFAGGANSVRGWGARSLGPGSMPRSASRSIFDQVGDIRLELSAEYRMRILGPVQLALFADAGNIWTIRPYENQPKGDFKWRTFYKEIALATGLGLRWDFDYFVLRFDLGSKLYDPQVENNRPWVITYQKLSDLVALHFGIGYPF